MVLAFVEYQHRTLASVESTAAHAARLTGLAERVAPMAERLGHLGAEFMVVASRIRTEGVYPADLASSVVALRPLLEEALALDDWITFDGRLVNTRAAIAAAAARDWDAAERHFAAALATAEALGNRIEQVDLGFWRARMLRDRDGPGDREAAAALMAEVAGRYRDLGLRRHAEVAAALLDRDATG